jgi:hypothetical protein
VTTCIKMTLVALAAAALAGCASGRDRSAYSERASSRSSERASVQTMTRAERACLRDVALEANNRDVVLLDATPSNQGTEVILGVGSRRARWRCIGYPDGTTTVVISLAEEAQL